MATKKSKKSTTSPIEPAQEVKKPSVKLEPEMMTYFDVYKRRHDGMFK